MPIKWAFVCDYCGTMTLRKRDGDLTPTLPKGWLQGPLHTLFCKEKCRRDYRHTRRDVVGKLTLRRL